jgi:pSer/pThr/pTyr-binding forkhead associated (FHA) protein/putative methionine-R-sulfoxide reductase with GAF domain
MPARLTLYLPDRPARVQTLRELTELVIGRDADCTVQVDDDRVSRRHAVLRPADGGWRLEDLGSKNGTQVDGVEASGAVPLATSAWLSFGGLLARFETLTEAQSARGAEDQLRRWQSSLEVQRQLTPTLGVGPLLERLLDSVLQLSGTERGFVLLADEAGELTLAASRGIAPDSLAAAEFAGSVGAVEHALAERRSVATSDALGDPRLAGRASIAEQRIRALICLPLLALDRVVGALYADSGKEGKLFTELDVEILEGLANHAALAVTVARLDAELAGVVAGLAARPLAPTVAGAPRWRDLVASRSVGPEGVP